MPKSIAPAEPKADPSAPAEREQSQPQGAAPEAARATETSPERPQAAEPEPTPAESVLPVARWLVRDKLAQEVKAVQRDAAGQVIKTTKRVQVLPLGQALVNFARLTLEEPLTEAQWREARQAFQAKRLGASFARKEG